MLLDNRLMPFSKVREGLDGLASAKKNGWGWWGGGL